MLMHRNIRRQGFPTRYLYGSKSKVLYINKSGSANAIIKVIYISKSGSAGALMRQWGARRTLRSVGQS